MALGKKWAGRIYGTNTGNLFLKLDGPDDNLVGSLHLNDAEFGFVQYQVAGQFDGKKISLEGQPSTQTEGVDFGEFRAAANLNSQGEFEGDWDSSTGPAGTFILYPHDRAGASIAPVERPLQLFTPREELGAIELDFDDIVILAEEIQKEFSKSQVAITFRADTPQSIFLSDFKKLALPKRRSDYLKVFGREAERDGLNKTIHIEFGPHVNFVSVESSDEAWALGQVIKLRGHLRPLERFYSTNYKHFGITLNAYILIAALAFMPSLSNFQERIVFLSIVMFLIAGIEWSHRRYLPFASIHLGKKPSNPFSRFFFSAISWLFSIIGGLLVWGIGAYLLGDWKPPFSM